MSRAACATRSCSPARPVIEPEDEPPQDRAARVEVARQVCAACPVRRPCLAYALRTRPAAGVWAGFTPEEITGLIAAAARPARVQRSTALRPAAERTPAARGGGVMTALDSRSWVCARVRGRAASAGCRRTGCAGSARRCPRRPARRLLPCGGARRPRRASRAARPRTCGCVEADTLVGVICLTLCGPCIEVERTPRLSCPDAVRRAMAARGAHRRAGVAW